MTLNENGNPVIEEKVETALGGQLIITYAATKQLARDSGSLFSDYSMRMGGLPRRIQLESLDPALETAMARVAKVRHPITHRPRSNT